MKPPKEAGMSKLWKLKIAVYGLSHALRVLYISVTEVLPKTVAEKSKFDDSIFYWYKNNKLRGLICHIGDFMEDAKKILKKMSLINFNRKLCNKS